MHDEPFSRLAVQRRSTLRTASSPTHSAAAVLLSVSVTVLLAAGVGCSRSRSDADVDQVSVVRVRVVGCGLADATAAGFGASDGRVVTVAHALRGARRVFVGADEARVIALDHRPDLAVLRVVGSGGSPRRWRTPRLAGARRGATRLLRTTASGADERRASTTPATVTKIAPITIEEPLDKTTYRRSGLVAHMDGEAEPIARGDSGSPLVDSEGRVIGVVFATDRAVARTAFAVSAGEIRAMLQAAHGTTSVPTGSCP